MSPDPMDPQEARLRRELAQIKERWLEDKQEDVSYLAEAFYYHYNLISVGGLGILTLMAAFMATPLFPLFAALLVAWELVWLTLGSTNERFRRMIRANKNAEVLAARESKREKSLNSLPVHMRAQHEAVQALAREIRKQAEDAEEGTVEHLDDTLAKLDFMLEQHARMLTSLDRIEANLDSPESDNLPRRVEALRAELEGMEAGRIKTAKEKNLAVLMQRLQRLEKSREEREYLQVSLDTLENTLKLVRERVVAATSAQGIANSLDEVVLELGRHREFMDEVEAQMGQVPPAPVAEAEQDEFDADREHAF